MSLEKPVSNGGTRDTRQTPTAPQKGTHTPSWEYVDHYSLVLTAPDGTEVKVGYDRATCYEKARAFTGTKVKARVVKEQRKFYYKPYFGGGER